MIPNVLCVLLLALPLVAQAPAGGRKPVPVRGVAAQAGEVEKDVAALTKSISWQTSLETAKELARKQGKLVFWIHMLGTLEGST